jgi:hypothetical protein
VIVKNLSKLDAEGNTVWSMDVTEPYSNYYDSPEIAIAGSGIIQSSTISSDSEGEKLIGISDLFVRKVSGGGDKDWNSTLGATGSINSSYAVSVAQDGSILVAGRTDHGLGGKSPAGKADGFIVKLDGSGSVEWVTLMGAAGGMVSALSVATDATGNIYAAGYTNVALYDQTLTGKQDAFVIKLTPSGERVWTRLYGAKAGTAQANSITLDLAGAIYVCGSTDMPLNGQKAYGKLDMFLMKTDGAGEPVWTDQMGAFEKATVARAVARYIGGDILLAGSMEGALAGKKPIGKEDAFAARFDSTGKLRWLFNIGAPGVHVSAWSIAADMEGTIYMAANTMGTYDPKQSTSGMDGLLIKITEK